MRRILSVALDRGTYLSAAYVSLRVPIALVFLGLDWLIFWIGLRQPWSVPLLFVVAAIAIWPVVLFERAVARGWFGVRLTPLGPDRPGVRTWPQRAIDLLSNPVTWKTLAYVLIESSVGLAAGAFVVLGILLGALGGLALAGTSLMSGLVGLVDAAPVPPELSLRTLGGAIVCAGLLVLALHVARWVTPLQLSLVRVMLGTSPTQLELAAARAEAALQHERAESAERSRRDLILNVSHELRNPLATIRAHVDTLREQQGEPPPEDRKRYLEVLHRETDRLSSLVDELLTLASADSGRLELDIEPIDATEVAAQVHEAMAPLAWRERHIKLLHAGERVASVSADRRRLAQVLMNLVRNAITHTPDGGIVAIDVKPLEGGVVEISVSDTGTGIAAGDIEKIFDRFYRTDASRSRATGGFGLGLAIAREMVEAMGGQIRVESSRGHGSRFIVTLGAA